MIAYIVYIYIKVSLNLLKSKYVFICFILFYFWLEICYKDGGRKMGWVEMIWENGN